MVIATIGVDGLPDTRYVLCRDVSSAGFVFYTNYGSAKSRQLDAAPVISAQFTWLQLHRQMKVRGRVERVGPEVSDAYFASRPRSSQIGAWASRQSSVLASRTELDDRVAELSERWPEGTEVPMPDFWGGYVIVPDRIEFWQSRQNRLHDRLSYRRSGENWTIERLSP